MRARRQIRSLTAPAPAILCASGVTPTAVAVGTKLILFLIVQPMEQAVDKVELST
jgi:hypothetical protein